MDPMDDIHKILLADQALLFFRNHIKHDSQAKVYFDVIKKYTNTEDEALMCYLEITNIGQQQSE